MFCPSAYLYEVSLPLQHEPYVSLSITSGALYHLWDIDRVVMLALSEICPIRRVPI